MPMSGVPSPLYYSESDRNHDRGHSWANTVLRYGHDSWSRTEGGSLETPVQHLGLFLRTVARFGGFGYRAGIMSYPPRCGSKIVVNGALRWSDASNGVMRCTGQN